MSIPIPDPVGVSKAAIIALMEEKPDTNLAYVKYFGKKHQAIHANFKSFDLKEFILSYETKDGSKGEVSINFKSPVTQVEDILPTLADMANEAEEHLKMSKSFTRVPTLTELNNTKAKSNKDVFYPPDLYWQLLIGVGLSTNFVLGFASDSFLRANIPQFLISIRDALSPLLIQRIFKGAVLCHLVEASIVSIICLKREYSTYINLKWTFSTFLFGVASLSKLLRA
ncbi:hypothetical protein BY458DRAFT_445436 [Sporodiniella umbellata]|nr:hypothetical protein BY458DRAFT_445436 [Sporodiniella umbellata]